MPTKLAILELLNISLRDFYHEYGKKIGRGGWALEDLVSNFVRFIQPHLQKEMMFNGAEWPVKTETTVKHHWENGEKCKSVAAGNHVARCKPSIIVHTPGTNSFNIFSLLIKCDWKVDAFDLYWNYWTAAALVADRKAYSFVICLELSQRKAASKAYLTSQDHLSRFGRQQFETLCDKLHAARYIDDGSQRKTEVEIQRALLFDDISDDLFGAVVASTDSH